MSDVDLLKTLKLDDLPDAPGGTIVNVAGLMNLGLKELNLRSLVLLFGMGLCHSKKRFPAAIGRIRTSAPTFTPHKDVPQDVTALIFNTSNVILTGAPNEYVARTGAWLLIYMLRKEGIPARMLNFEVENIASKFSLGFKVDLDKFFEHLGAALVTYVPELFPAALYCENKQKKKKKKHLTVLVNYTGSLVITGAQNRQDLLDQYRKIYLIAMQFRVDDKNSAPNMNRSKMFQKYSAVQRLIMLKEIHDGNLENLKDTRKVRKLGSLKGKDPIDENDDDSDDLEGSYIVRLPTIAADSVMAENQLSYEPSEIISKSPPKKRIKKM